MRDPIVIEEIEIPNNVNIEIKDGEIIVKGPKGEVRRKLSNKKINILIKDNKVRLFVYFPTRKELRDLYTIKAHIKNDIEGVRNGFVYKLKAVYTHFPFKIKIQGDEFIVENFLGEKSSRKIKIPKGVKVKIEGDYIYVESHNIELAGNFAGLLEKLTYKKEKDLRKFQDGIYIVEKP